MAVLGVIVFVSLYFVDAGYGKMISSKWARLFRTNSAGA